MSADPAVRILTERGAREARAAHEARADALTAEHRERRRRGEKHPVEDFLFTYYPFSLAQLRRWHPGVGVRYDAAADLDARGNPVSGDVRVLDRGGDDGPDDDGPDDDGPGDDGPGTAGPVGPAGYSPRTTRSWYVDERAADGRVLRGADVERFVRERADALGFITRLLESSSLASRRPQLGCLGLHEWAMVHRLPDGARRHEDLPLRLGAAETDAVLERERLVCTHIDAFRFFTPAARPRNAEQPTRERQAELDNPACLHVGMDLYKWAMKLVPLVDSPLVLDCFEHARRARVLDMEASPYDVRPLGYGVVAIETPAGKAEYVRRQRELAAAGEVLRARLRQALAAASASRRSCSR